MLHTVLRRSSPSRALGALGLLACLTGPIVASQRWVDSLPGEFVDIRATGASVAPSNDGEFEITTTVGNSLFPAGTVRISANGGARFGPSTGSNLDLPPVNGALPSSAAFGGSQALLPYWDDYISTLGLFVFGSIQHQEIDGVLYIQWTNVRLQSALVQDRMTFQLQVPSTGMVFARFVYLDVAGSPGGGLGATIGYQGPSLADTAQYSLDANHAVDDGTVLSLVDQANQELGTGISGTFIDIATTGTPLDLGDNGQSVAFTPVRSAILQQGRLTIASNGGIGLDVNAGGLAATNAPLPSGAAFALGQALLPFWDDIDTQGGAVGNIYVEHVSGRTIVQWDDVGFAGAPPTERATFQVQLFSDDAVLAQIIYRDVEGTRAARGGSATIGYQPASMLQTEPFSFNQPVLEDGLVVTFYRDASRGTIYCTANTNSTAGPAVISASGNLSIAQNNFFLRAEDLPFNATSFFLVSATSAFVANPGGSQGNLCLGGAIGRGVGGILDSGNEGFVFAHPNLAAMPTAGGSFAVQPGDTLCFQCWHRDVIGGVTTSNFTPGLQVQFKP